MLVLRIDFLNGVYHAADPTAHRQSEWPPHPDRLFQALVAAAYGSGISPEPLRALEGAAPELVFAAAEAAVSGSLYPPATWLERPTGEPWKRTNVIKHDPVRVGISDPVYLIWRDVPDTLQPALAAIAAGVSHLGRAKTPVVVALADEVPELPHRLLPSPTGESLLRVPQAGRLAELDAAFAAGRRAGIADMVGYTDAVDRVAPSPWGELLALRPHRLLDSRRAAQWAGALRAAVLSLAGDAASPLLHGHGGDHAAWAVIPDVGHAHARGHVLGLGLWLPRAIDADARADCLLPLLQVQQVRVGHLAVDLSVVAARQQVPQGLARATWSRPARTWASVTPVVLDRHPKRGESVEDLVADSLELAGYPRPLDVAVGQRSIFRGVAAAHEFTPRGRGRWTHVALKFARRVAGPMLVGKERHFSMGLLRPADDRGVPA